MGRDEVEVRQGLVRDRRRAPPLEPRGDRAALVRVAVRGDDGVLHELEADRARELVGERVAAEGRRRRP